MKKIYALDCTLRDGLRIVDCKFHDNDIKGMAAGLQEAGIDIIEMGFLRDEKLVSYTENSTFFTDVKQIQKFIPEHDKETIYVAFVDYNMFDFDMLQTNDGLSVDGIRVGFTKKDFLTEFDGVIRSMKKVKEKGYKLFLQGVNSLGYSDDEFLKIIKMANEVGPYAFAIVDTYGAMYKEDVLHYFELIKYNLDPEIMVDFHSHNNYQMSFALAQEFVRMSGERNIIIDCTLNGVGKVAGNLNTELLIHFLNEKMGAKYDDNMILDLIDRYLFSIRNANDWGYSIPALLSGQMKSHPNNVLYLTKRFSLNMKDIKYILSMINPEVRQRYDYENIERLFIEYNSSMKDDANEILVLRKEFADKPVLIVGPGRSIVSGKDRISDFIEHQKPVVLSLNFIPDEIKCEYVFWGNIKRYEEERYKLNGEKIIFTSNVKCEEEAIIVDYAKLIECGEKYFDSSFIMLMNLLARIDVKKIFVAGVDGFSTENSNYCRPEMEYGRNIEEYSEINSSIKKFLRKYKKCNENIRVSFITPSNYQSIYTKE